MEYPISPAVPEEALRSAPDHMKEKYRIDGITLYREIITLPNSEIKRVEEGYVELVILPNGKELPRKIPLRLILPENAQEPNLPQLGSK